VAAESTTSRRWWAPIGLGAVICIGCCLAPILIAAGILGGGITLLSLPWLERLGSALLVAGMIGLIWSRDRARRTACTGTSSATACTGGCRCATGTTP
jgi:hypothetical protein